MKQVNLAVPEDRQLLKFLILRRLGLRVVLIGFMFVLTAIALSGVSVWYVLRVQKQALAEISELQKKENVSDYGKVRDEIKEINNFIGDTSTIFERVPKFSRATDAIFKVLPSDISLQSLSFEVSKKQVVITGFSPTRESVLELHRRISTDKQTFAQIDYPLENLARPKNVPFFFTVTFADKIIH